MAAANEILTRLRHEHASSESRLLRLPKDTALRRESESIVVDAWRVLQAVPDADVERCEDGQVCIGLLQSWTYFYNCWGRTVDGPPAEAVQSVPPSKALAAISLDVEHAASVTRDGAAREPPTANATADGVQPRQSSNAAAAASAFGAAPGGGGAVADTAGGIQAMTSLSDVGRSRRAAMVVADDLPAEDEDPFAEML